MTRDFLKKINLPFILDTGYVNWYIPEFSEFNDSKRIYFIVPVNSDFYQTYLKIHAECTNTLCDKIENTLKSPHKSTTEEPSVHFSITLYPTTNIRIETLMQNTILNYEHQKLKIRIIGSLILWCKNCSQDKKSKKFYDVGLKLLPSVIYRENSK